MTEVKNREVFKMHYLLLYNPFSGRQTIAEAVPQMVLQVPLRVKRQNLTLTVLEE